MATSIIPAGQQSSTTQAKVEYLNNLGKTAALAPPRIAILGSGDSNISYSLNPKTITSAEAIGSVMGYKNPVYYAAQRFFPINGEGPGVPVTVYPVATPGSGSASVGTVVVAAGQTGRTVWRIESRGRKSADFVVETGDDLNTIGLAMVTAVGANKDFPFTSTFDTATLTMTSAYKGLQADDLNIKIIQTAGTVGEGPTFTLTQPTGGAATFDVAAALSNIGDNWETHCLNCFGEDSAVITEINNFDEARWGQTINKPSCVWAYGDTQSDLNTATLFPSNNTGMRTVGKFAAPGVVELPVEVCAAVIKTVVGVASTKPSFDYQGARVLGLTIDPDIIPWTNNAASREFAVNNGVSTTRVRNGVLTIEDLITFSQPEGELYPPYKWIVKKWKIINLLYNVLNIFEADNLLNAPLLNDESPSLLEGAVRPKNIKTLIANITTSLEQDFAILVNTAENNKRTDVTINNVDQLATLLFQQISGNTRQKSVIVQFDFFRGGA